MTQSEPLDIATIDHLQKEMRGKFALVPEAGIAVDYLGQKFVVFKNVFWPFEDSKPLVAHFVVNPGEIVLDVCTGSGVIAIFAALKGAAKVVALDISPEAVKNAEHNVRLHDLGNTVEVRQSDMFDSLTHGDQFDVITANLPFHNKPATNAAEATQWDEDLALHKKFFAKVRTFLKPNGRVYMSQANFGAVSEMEEMAKAAGFVVKMIGQQTMPKGDPRVFYAFELT
jgi:release factor glutamine methyltransferase